MSQSTPSDELNFTKNRTISGCMTKLTPNAITILVVLIIAVGIFSLARAAIYKIRPY